MSGYTELRVWHRAMDLAAMVHALSPSMPKNEQFGMTSQMLRAVASVPAIRVGHLPEAGVAPSLALADELSRMLTRLKRQLDAAPIQS